MSNDKRQFRVDTPCVLYAAYLFAALGRYGYSEIPKTSYAIRFQICVLFSFHVQLDIIAYQVNLGISCIVVSFLILAVGLACM